MAHQRFVLRARADELRLQGLNSKMTMHFTARDISELDRVALRNMYNK